MDENTENLIEVIADAASALGRIQGYEECAGFLLNLAADKFMEGNDGDAKFVRELATGMKQEAQHFRSLYDLKDKLQQGKAWKTLDQGIGDINWEEVKDA